MRALGKRIVATGAALLALAGIASILLKRDAVAFHRKEMVASFAAASSSRGEQQSEHLESLSYHRDRLTTLGYFERRVFPLKHIQPQTPEWKGLFLALNGLHTNIADGLFAMQGHGEATPRQVVVWTRPQYMPRYAQVISERDH